MFHTLSTSFSSYFTYCDHRQKHTKFAGNMSVKDILEADRHTFLFFENIGKLTPNFHNSAVYTKHNI